MLTQRELSEKIKKYGVRGLARKIGADPGYLSKLKNGKKDLAKLSLNLQAKIMNS